MVVVMVVLEGAAHSCLAANVLTRNNEYLDTDVRLSGTALDTSAVRPTPESAACLPRERGRRRRASAWGRGFCMDTSRLSRGRGFMEPQEPHFPRRDRGNMRAGYDLTGKLLDDLPVADYRSYVIERCSRSR